MSGLTGFGAAIVAVEAERMEQALLAIEAGWTPGDHPEVCCPETAPAPQTVRTTDPEYAYKRRRSAEAKVLTLVARLAALSEPQSRPADRGEANIPFNRREKATEALIDRAVKEQELRAELVHARSRVKYWAQREGL